MAEQEKSYKTREEQQENIEAQLEKIRKGFQELYGSDQVCLECGLYDPKDRDKGNLSPVMQKGRNWEKEVSNLLRENGIDLEKLMNFINEGKPENERSDIGIGEHGDIHVPLCYMIPDLMNKIRHLISPDYQI